MKKLLENLILFMVFGAVYYTIETLWKFPHPSHFSMYIVGGIMGITVGIINEEIPWEIPLHQQCFIGMLVITLTEGVAGILLNKVVMLHVWDYSQMPLTFFQGQCCVPFCIAWYFLSAIAIILDDYLRYWLFGEEKPHYTL